MLTLASITEGSGKLDFNQKDFSNSYECNSLTLLKDATEENIINGIPEYQFEKSDSVVILVTNSINLSRKSQIRYYLLMKMLVLLLDLKQI